MQDHLPPRGDRFIDKILTFLEDNPIGQTIMGCVIFVAFGLFIMGMIVFGILASWWTGNEEWLDCLRGWRPR